MGRQETGNGFWEMFGIQQVYNQLVTYNNSKHSIYVYKNLIQYL